MLNSKSPNRDRDQRPRKKKRIILRTVFKEAGWGETRVQLVDRDVPLDWRNEEKRRGVVHTSVTPGG